MKTKKVAVSVKEIMKILEVLKETRVRIMERLPWDNLQDQTIVKVNINQVFGPVCRILEKYTDRAEDQR